MAVQKELHGTPQIEVGVKVPRIGQDVDEPIDHAEGHGPLHPINLSLFPGKKLQRMVGGVLSLFPERKCAFLYCRITSLIAVALQSFQYLNGLKKRIFLCTTAVLTAHRESLWSLKTFFEIVLPNETGNLLPRYAKFLRHLVQTQPFNLIEVPHPALK